MDYRCTNFLFQFNQNNTLIGSTPELLIDKKGIDEVISTIASLPDARGPAIARARERLLATHQESLLLHPKFSDVIKSLSEGALSIEEALGILHRG